MNSKLTQKLRKLFSQIMKPSVRQKIGNNCIINPHLLQLDVKVKNEPGILNKILSTLSNLNVNLHNIESNFKSKDWQNAYLQIFVENTKKKHQFKDFEAALRPLGCQISEFKTPLIPDFPIRLTDLDDFNITLGNIDETLSQDHPGINDQLYKDRRNHIGLQSKDYKMHQKIPKIEYNENEVGTWKYLYPKLREYGMEYADRDFIKNLKLLEKEGLFKGDEIPQLDEINSYLRGLTNWRIKPVNGLLSQREYLNCLAFRTFPSTQYIRHHSRPLFTPEPDLVHEFMGHIPHFCDPVFCDISQEIGMLSLGASDSIVELIGSVYWFTIEFGTCKEDDKMKYYGAGLSGGYGEILNFLNNPKLRKLDVEKHFTPTDIILHDVQPYYYYIESFPELLDQLRALSNKLSKAFKYTMNNDSTELFIDRKIETYPEMNKKDLFN